MAIFGVHPVVVFLSAKSIKSDVSIKYYLFALNSDNKISYLEIMIRLNNKSSDNKMLAILDTENILQWVKIICVQN